MDKHLKHAPTLLSFAFLSHILARVKVKQLAMVWFFRLHSSQARCFEEVCKAAAVGVESLMGVVVVVLVKV